MLASEDEPPVFNPGETKVVTLRVKRTVWQGQMLTRDDVEWDDAS